MRILIATYSFFPVIIPRGLHVFELAKAFVREGHQVRVLCADSGFNYREIEQRSGMEILPLSPGVLFHRGDVFAGFRAGEENRPECRSDTETPLSLRRRILRGLFEQPAIRFVFDGIYPQGVISEFFFPLFRQLLRERGNYDLLLSVALPLAVHGASALACLLRPQLARVRLAEYGDPFSWQFKDGLGRYSNAPLERLILRAFHALVIPVDSARPAYHHLVEDRRIHVISQGVNPEDYPVSPRSGFRSIPHFAYAGRFFRGFRDPSVLLAHLASSLRDFRFTIFTNLQDASLAELILPWQEKLGERLQLRPMLTRHACIRLLADQDFLIQMDNLRAEQVPSKSIDYALSGRPVFRFRSDQFDSRRFDEALEGKKAAFDPPLDPASFCARRRAHSYLQLARDLAVSGIS